LVSNPNTGRTQTVGVPEQSSKKNI